MKDTNTEKNTACIVRREILTQIMESGNFTVPDIVENTGISPTTISKYVFDMQKDGLLSVLDTVKTERRGRRPMLYGLKSGSQYFVGVDIKNFTLDIGLMDLSGNFITHKADDGFCFENTFAKLEYICKEVEAFISGQEGIDPSQISGICFAMGGRVNSKLGTSATTFNFEEFGDGSLADFLAERFHCPVIIENDTKVMAYGEYLQLKKSGVRDMLYVNIGWGLGIGIIVDGELVSGHNGYAGEFGHVSLYNNNIICHCGKKGCIETEVSGNAIHRKLVTRIKTGEQSVLSGKVLGGEVVTLKDMLRAAAREDPLCVDLISSMGSELGRHLAGLINIFNPECIVIGGTFSEAATYYFMHPIIDSIRKYSLRLISKDVKVMTTPKGESGGAYGACMLARNRIFLEQFA